MFFIKQKLVGEGRRFPQSLDIGGGNGVELVGGGN